MSPASTGTRSTHYDLIKGKAPAWMLTAPAATFGALRGAVEQAPPTLEKACLKHPKVARMLAEEHARLRTSKAQAHTLFSRLPPLQVFATRLLTEAIKEQFQQDIDVTKTYYFDAVDYAKRREQADVAPERFVRPLLHHALQNFEVAATQADTLEVPMPHMRSVILDQRGYGNGPPFANVVDIEPTAFAALCRSLDIGGQYQALLDGIYYPATPAQAPWQDRLVAQTPVLDTLGEVELSAFKQSLHGAFLQGLISNHAHGALWATPLETLAQADKQLASFNFLTLWGIELTGWVLIQFEHTTAVALYTRNAGDSALKAFASFEALKLELRNAIQNDLAFISGHIPDAHKAQTIAKLQDLLLPLTFTRKNIYERVADPEAVLPIAARPFNYPFRAELLYQNYTRLRDDARFHAVPTLAMDAKTLHDRLAYFESLALDALNLVGFVVPEIGYMMMALATLQLSQEVYEGIDSWANDDRQQALAYLLDVLQNLALIGLGTAVAQGAKAALHDVPAVPTVPVETPSFIEELIEVELPDGSKRLWNPDLTPYAQNVSLPPQATPDQLGIYRHADRLWLKLDGKLYALKWNSTGGHYSVVHPSRYLGYQPPLRHNGAGAWLHELDRPREWQGSRLLNRLAPLSQTFGEPTLARILQVSGVEEGALRHALAENQRMPALLEDTLLRFRLDREVNQSLPHAPARLRQAAFQERYQQQLSSTTPQSALLRRIYPQLPNAVLEELLRNAATGELTTLNEGRVPKRLGHEVRHYQQQIRLARAYEGVYLDSVRNGDSDLLILNSLPQLENWPADLKFELHDGGLQAELIDSIGPDNAAHLWIITRYPQGYTASNPLPSALSAPLHETLYAALQQALDTHAGGFGLRERMLQAAPLPRGLLRRKLGMQRHAFRSPMRLADGRLGYPLSPLVQDLARIDRFSRFARLIEEQGFPPQVADWLTNALLEEHATDAQILRAINNLPAPDAAQQLQACLAAWRADPLRIADPLLANQSRDMIETGIWWHWVQNATGLRDTLETRLYLHTAFLEEFPSQLPNSFSETVRNLFLEDVVFNFRPDALIPPGQEAWPFENLFRQFPNLEILAIDRPYIANASAELTGRLPLIHQYFANLDELHLVNQNLTLSVADIEQLASPATLQYLDLSGNTLAPAPAATGNWTLQFLCLDRMALSTWPAWLDGATLSRINAVSLSDNALRSLPDFFNLNLPAEQSTIVTLERNPLSRRQLISLAFSEDEQTRRFRFNLSLNQSVQQALDRLVEQRRQLRQALADWLNAHPASLRKKKMAEDFCEFWIARMRGFDDLPLHIIDQDVADLPDRLPDFFKQTVDSLILEGVDGSMQQFDQLLSRYPNLVTLTLDELPTDLPALPASIAQLPLLTELELSNLGLDINDATLQLLARLPSLEMLDLSGNRLSPSLRGPFNFARRLKCLVLNEVGMSAWPTWLYELMPTGTLDLESNHMTSLPDVILGVPVVDEPSTTISLRDNPLDEATRQRMDTRDGDLKLYLPHGFRPN
ncbi:dermonecrotic toxin domain-containing protein [Pseudomonas sp. NPDC089752]|uniref:dermonecrotic toxin domain-containing protein n=1 Tax=Pseudomonas sp. NPDC089752 TaxID=3364472 RepID=UPI003826D5B4